MGANTSDGVTFTIYTVANDGVETILYNITTSAYNTSHYTLYLNNGIIADETDNCYQYSGENISIILDDLTNISKLVFKVNNKTAFENDHLVFYDTSITINKLDNSDTFVHNASQTGGWKLMRSQPADSLIPWHAGINDNCVFHDEHYSEYLFTTGDEAYWLTCPRSSVDRVYGTSVGSTMSYVSRTSHPEYLNAESKLSWYLRGENRNPEDPWISIGGHPNFIIYAENGNSARRELAYEHGGAHVYIR